MVAVSLVRRRRRAPPPRKRVDARSDCWPMPVTQASRRGAWRRRRASTTALFTITSARTRTRWCTR
jgi:hypothetical protein